jgi:fucose permease
MPRLTRASILLLTVASFLAFFVFGFTDNLKGPTLPAMMAELRLSYTAGGNIFFGEYLGFLIATLFVGVLSDRFGLKVVMLLASGLLVLGAGGYSSFATPTLLSLSIFILGFGLGGFELASNALIVSVHHERKGLFLNLMSVFHGLGSMVAPLVASWLLIHGVIWRTIYRWDIVLAIGLLVYLLALRFPQKDQQEHEAIDFKQLPRIAFRRSLAGFYFAIALYVAAEIGIGSWMVTFLQRDHGLSVAASNQALTFFFAMIMLGRFIGGFFVQRIGYLRSILIASIAGMTCIGLGLFGPASLSFFLPLTGLFFSIIFPTITAAVADTHTQNTNSILGMLFTSAGIGGMLGPWLIGFVSDRAGLSAGISMTLFFTVLLGVSILVLMRGEQNGTTNA